MAQLQRMYPEKYLSYLESNARSSKKTRSKLRVEIVSLLGGKCVRCGFEDIRALQIDHVNGGANKEVMKKYGKPYSNCHRYVLIRDAILLGSKEYQLLCANCNWIKRFENKEIKTVYNYGTV